MTNTNVLERENVRNTDNVSIYFYNGFDKPELMAKSFLDLMEITITDNYLGDKTAEMLEELNEYCVFQNNSYLVPYEWEEVKTILADYGLFLEPGLDELVEVTLTWFSKNAFPYHLLEDFGKSWQIDELLTRVYDDFKKYPEYKNQYIIESWIRHKDYSDTVIAAYDNLGEAEQWMDDEDFWEEGTLLGVDKTGRAYYPQF